MENAYTQEKHKNGGYMTLFACLLFLAMMTLLFVCLEGILIFQGKSTATMAMAGAGEHLLANYDEVLARRYALYFLDSRMEPRLNTRTELYFEKRLNPFSQTGRQPILDLKAEQVQVNAYGTMQEQECRYFKDQIVEVVQYDTAKDLLEQLLSDSAQSVEDQNKNIEKVKNQLETQEAAIQAASEENTENVTASSNAVIQKQAASLAQAGSPVSVMKALFQQGILTFVTDDKKLSEKQISSSNLPSDSKKEKIPVISFKNILSLSDWSKLLNESQLLDLSKSIKENGSLAIYSRNYFNYFTREDVIPDTELAYEFEYILGGHTSDMKNLDYVAKRLLLLRFAMNSGYVLSDAGWNEQALLLAGQLTGISGSPAVVEGTKYVILCVVSLIESLYDVKALMAGDQVPLLKNDASFQTDITGQYMKKQGITGLSYANYLMLLFLLESDTKRQCLRMQDLIQINICREQPEFSILKPGAGITIESVFLQKGKFLSDVYTHEMRETYSY